MIKVEIENDGRIIRLPDGLSAAEIAAAIDALPPPTPLRGRFRASHVEPYQGDDDNEPVTAHYTCSIIPDGKDEKRYANGIWYGLAHQLASSQDAANPGGILPSIVRRSELKDPTDPGSRS